MNDYSDIIMLMGAMIIFSLLSIQVNQMLRMNNRVQLNAEVEYNAVSIAQDNIDQIQWLASEPALNNHVNSFPKEVPIAIENDTLFYNVTMDVADMTIPGSNVASKIVTVKVANEFLQTSSDTASQGFVQMKFIKSFN